jgi:hypothetical protein
MWCRTHIRYEQDTGKGATVTLDHPEFMTLVSEDIVADLAASAAAIEAAMATVRAVHSGYRFINPNEIRCNDRACSRILPINPGVDSPDAVYAGHQTAELDALLVECFPPTPDEGLGN